MNISLEKIIENVFDGFRKITPMLIAIAIGSGLLLFLPSALLEKMALNNLSDKTLHVVGIVFIVSIALILTILCYSVFSPICYKLRNKRLRSILRKNYLDLSQEKKRLIIRILNSPAGTLELNPDDSAVRYLESKNFIAKARNYSFVSYGESLMLPYTAQAWLMDLYDNEPNLF